MSLAIDPATVTHVLLADGWHRIEDESFCLDAYEYVEGDLDSLVLIHGGGASGVCTTGFRFLEDLDGNAGTAHVGDHQCVSGPLTSVLAVTERRPK